jgi:hypothetical protein
MSLLGDTGGGAEGAKAPGREVSVGEDVGNVCTGQFPALSSTRLN